MEIERGMNWRRNVQNARVEYLVKHLQNGGAGLPFEALQKHAMKQVPGKVSIGLNLVKKIAFAVEKNGKIPSSVEEARRVRLPLASNMSTWVASRAKTPPQPRKNAAPSVETQNSDLLSVWWERNILPLLEDQGIIGVKWEKGEPAEVTLLARVTLTRG